jgi:hypothetical protein
MVAMPSGSTNRDKDMGISVYNSAQPNSKFGSKHKYVKKTQGELCKKGCGSYVIFDAEFPKSKNGKWVPHNLSDGLPHVCPNDPRAQSSHETIRSSHDQQKVGLSLSSSSLSEEDLNTTKADMILQGIAENRAELAHIKKMVEDLFQQRKHVGSVKG